MRFISPVQKLTVNYFDVADSQSEDESIIEPGHLWIWNLLKEIRDPIMIILVFS